MVIGFLSNAIKFMLYILGGFLALLIGFSLLSGLLELASTGLGALILLLILIRLIKMFIG